jgi:hypothetical protein
MTFLSAQQRSTLIEALETQLSAQPFRETRNRKRLRPNPLAPWELRVGTLRAFYDADPDDSQAVNILAVGIKQRNVLVIAGREFQI